MESNITPDFLKAFALFQGECKAITKDCQNKFLKNKYATLDAIIEDVKPLLSKHGLSFCQLLNLEGVETILMHESGGYLSSGIMKIEPQVNNGISYAQAVGIATTYTKRYQIGSLLGISTEEDTDGQYGDNKGLSESKREVKEKKWLNKFSEGSNDVLQTYTDTLLWAREKGHTPEKLREYYNISKEVFEHVKKDLS